MSNGNNSRDALSPSSRHISPYGLDILDDAGITPPLLGDPDNGNVEEPPPLEPITTPTLTTTLGNSVHETAVDRDEGSLPDLQSVSDSSAEDHVMEPVAEDNSIDVEGNLPGATLHQPFANHPRTSERRARVEDAEDEDNRPARRQRRSRSQFHSALPQVAPTSAPRSPPQSPPAGHAHLPFHFGLPFLGNVGGRGPTTQLFNPGNVGLNPARMGLHAHVHHHGHHAHNPQHPEPMSQPNSQAQAPPPHDPAPAPPPAMPPGAEDFGFAMAFDGSGNPLGAFPFGARPRMGRPGAPGPGNNGNMNPMEAFTGFLNAFQGVLTGMVPTMEEVDDPERAKKLVAGLEVVPYGLVRRMELAGGATGGQVNDVNAVQSDAPGCAVCWDSLLDAEGGGFGEQAAEVTSADTSNENTAHSLSESTKADQPEALPKIIALPCSHVFHASCLIPWFSRPKHTTCPTCRFDVDPDSLTYTPSHRPPRSASQPTQTVPDQDQPAAAAAAQAVAPIDQPTGEVANPPSNTTPNAAHGHNDDRLPAPDPPGTTGPPPGMMEQIVLDINIMIGPAPPSGTPRQASEAAPGPAPNGGGAPPVFHINSPADFQNFFRQMAAGFPGLHARADGPAAPIDNTAPQDGTPSASRSPTAHGSAPPPDAPVFGPGPLPAQAPGGVPPTTFGPFIIPIGQFPGGPGPRPANAPASLPRAPRTEPRQRREWAPPPAPGPTVRQRVERKERELGLRCCDSSCGIGPSDEDPSPEISVEARKQVAIYGLEEDANSGRRPACEHTFHPACLVVSERVAGWDGRARDEQHIPVACPICRATGCVQKQDWEEGVVALA